MAVDLTQKTLKARLSGIDQPPLMDFEIRMWEITRDILQASAQNKIDPYLPNKTSLTSVAYFKRLTAVCANISKFIGNFSKDIARDPKHIRKYFSVGGVIAIVTDFFTSGYQETVRQELTNFLAKKHLLLTPSQCGRLSKALLIVGILSATISSLAPFFVLPWQHALACTLLAASGASVVFAAMILKAWIPLYPELANLSSHVQRKDWRISLVRILVYSFHTITRAIIFAIFALELIAAGIILQISAPNLLPNYLVFLAVTELMFLVSFSVIKHAYAVRFNSILTSLGRSRLHQARQRLSKISPATAFGAMLQSDEYLPQFSEIVAIYGIAPLIFLA